MDLLTVDLSANVALIKKYEVSETGQNIALTGKNELKEPDLFYGKTPLKDENTALKDALIHSLNAQVKLLQNQLEQMEIDRHEKEGKPRTQSKEAKSA